MDLLEGEYGEHFISLSRRVNCHLDHATIFCGGYIKTNMLSSIVAIRDEIDGWTIWAAVSVFFFMFYAFVFNEIDPQFLLMILIELHFDSIYACPSIRLSIYFCNKSAIRIYCSIILKSCTWSHICLIRFHIWVLHIRYIHFIARYSVQDIRYSYEIILTIYFKIGSDFGFSFCISSFNLSKLFAKFVILV